MFGGACAEIPPGSPVESTIMVITFSKGMGLKEAGGVFHQIITRPVPGVKKGYCVENQAAVTDSVTDPHSLPFIYSLLT